MGVIVEKKEHKYTENIANPVLAKAVLSREGGRFFEHVLSFRKYSPTLITRRLVEDNGNGLC